MPRSLSRSTRRIYTGLLCNGRGLAAGYVHHDGVGAADVDQNLYSDGLGGLGGNGQKVTSNLTCNVSHAMYCGSASKNCYVEHDPGGGGVACVSRGQ